jgi:thiol-disulfide isomerase/thioredoxin
MKEQMELMTKLNQWSHLNEEEQAETTDWLVGIVKAEPNGVHAGMLMMFADSLSDTHGELAKRALSELVPVLSKSEDPGVHGRLPMLEGLLRRLDLPGSEIEVAGTFLDGTKLDWASYRGKVVLVDFWATWCGPCRAEVPNVLENYLKYHDKGFEVIGISLDETREAAEQYVQQTNIPWPSIFSEEESDRGWQAPMAVKYGITGIPTAILVDQEGKVVSMNARGPRLGALLENLLGKAGKEAANVNSRESEQTAQSAR